MAESEGYICWSCGISLPAINARDACGEPAIPFPPRPPNEIIPFCGMIDNTDNLPDSGPFVWQCCKCHEKVKWKDIDDYQIGPCPHCHAWGMFGAVEEY